MPKIFQTLDKVRPVYDVVYKVVLFICKFLLVADILITSYAVLGRYIPFIADPSWSEEVVLTLMSYMAVLSAAIAIRHKEHIRMDAFDRYIPKPMLHFLNLLSNVAVLAIIALIKPIRSASPAKTKNSMEKMTSSFSSVFLGLP